MIKLIGMWKIYHNFAYLKHSIRAKVIPSLLYRELADEILLIFGEGTVILFWENLY